MGTGATAGELWNLKISVRWLLLAWEVCSKCTLVATRIGSSASVPVVLARFGAGATISSSSSSSSSARVVSSCFGSILLTGDACLFLGALAGVGAESFGVAEDAGFWVKKLEMLACFRFNDGEGAEDCEE